MGGCAKNKMEAKYQIIGLTKLLSELSPKLIANDQGKMVFAQIVAAIVTVIASPTFSREEKGIPEEAPVVYDATFSQLKYAQQLQDDALRAVADPIELFFSALRNISQSNPGILPPLIQQGLGNNVELATSFQKMCQTKG